jgi:hypothetical protein
LKQRAFRGSMSKRRHSAFREAPRGPLLRVNIRHQDFRQPSSNACCRILSYPRWSAQPSSNTSPKKPPGGTVTAKRNCGDSLPGCKSPPNNIKETTVSGPSAPCRGRYFCPPITNVASLYPVSLDLMPNSSSHATLSYSGSYTLDDARKTLICALKQVPGRPRPER